MKGLLEFGLSKLKITAFSDRERKSGAELSSMKVMYNPESLDLRYDIDYDSDSYLNGSICRNHFKQVRPGTLQLELLFDASVPGNTLSVESQLATLQLMCCEVNAVTMEAPYLKVEWGTLHWGGKDHFSGRLASLQVRYTRFGRKGEPMRATVQLTLQADESEVLDSSALAELKRPPTLPVTDMTFLPMLAPIMVGAAAALVGAYNYLAVAEANDLDNLDAVEPGDVLVTPPADDVEEAQT